ncbi:MAG: T9SS type A sorting domain-containing protein, partial [Bacteroidia bacterium]|nr:T9SS type A sorting domain-containing protein [Bacteroidia bacterium]
PYTLRFYGFNGCGGTVAQVQVTSLSHEVAQGGWRLYPNPTRSEVWVDAPVGGGEVRIYTLMGQLVGRWPVEEGQSRLLLEGLSRGLYIVRLIGGRTVGQEKLLLE